MSVHDDLAHLANWAAQCVGADASVTAMTPLRPDAPRWLLEVNRGGASDRVILKAGSSGMREELATEAAALELAEANGLATPRLIGADIDGRDAGGPAVLMSYIDGTDRIPTAVSAERLRALGAAAAAFHQLALAPSEKLPLRVRPMPWIDFTTERRQGNERTTALLERADHLLDELSLTATSAVFVHGDLWAGNTLWRDGTYVATIDWEAAGAGSYGVDLGSLRLDAALLHGADAPDHVLAGWTVESGHTADEVTYWDIVAAANTTADMAGSTPTIHQAGRTDLDGALLTRRRDQFLEAALHRLA